MHYMVQLKCKLALDPTMGFCLMILTYLFGVDNGTCVNKSRVEKKTDDNLYANVEKSANAESQKPPMVRILCACQSTNCVIYSLM